VTVYGSDFIATPDSVTFGGVQASSVVIENNDEIEAVVPPESSAMRCADGTRFRPKVVCQVEVVVSNANGTSPVSAILPGLAGKVTFDHKGVVEPTRGTEVAPAATEYDYSPRPVITGVTPSFAKPSGTAPITITGRDFSFLTFDWVNIGPFTSTQSEQVKIRYISRSTIVIDPPAVNLTSAARVRGGLSVQSGSGLSNVVHFGYSATPVVKRLSVHSGPSNGGTLLHILAANVLGVSSVRFVPVTGSTAFLRVVALPSEVTSGSIVTVKSPADSAGTVDVELCTAAGCSRADPLWDNFAFVQHA
jgi:hypothetical protein